MGGAGAFHQYHDSFEPPFQHFEDIVRNAELFRNRWNMWPMEGWLTGFEQAGLIRRDGTAITILQQPGPALIESARVTPG